MENPIFRGRLKAPHSDRLKDFYESVFDWKLVYRTINGREYFIIEPGSGPGGDPHGSIENDGADLWIPFVLVESVDENLKKAKANGASIIEERTEFAGEGYYGIFKDPVGGVLGVWEKP